MHDISMWNAVAAGDAVAVRKQIDALVVYVAAYNIPTINAFANVTGSLDEKKNSQ